MISSETIPMLAPKLIAQGLLLARATAETCSDDVTELLQVPWGDGSQGMAIGMKALGAL